MGFTLWWFHFDLWRLSAKTKTHSSLIQETLFADDWTFMAHKSGDLQAMLKSFSDASKQFGLTISLGKTEVLFQRAPNSVAPQPAIFIDDVELKVVDSFKYLGSMVSNDGSLDKEIASRISKASQALGRLRNRLLNHHNVSFDTKLKVYRAVILSSLLYGQGRPCKRFKDTVKAGLKRCGITPIELVATALDNAGAHLHNLRHLH